MDILDDMGVSKLSAKVVLKVNYSFKISQCCSQLKQLGHALGFLTGLWD